MSITVLLNKIYIIDRILIARDCPVNFCRSLLLICKGTCNTLI